MFRVVLSRMAILFFVVSGLISQTSAQEKLQFKQWVDPTESAFSLDVPVGWKISGGIKRASDTRSEITMQSPDNQIIVKIGDVNVPLSYVELSQTLASLGYREGQMASNTLQIRSYLSGTQFAGAYLQSAVAQRCSNVQLINKQDRADYVQALRARGLVPGFATAYTAGEVMITCQANGQKYIAYSFAETYKVNYQGTGTAWALKTLYAFIAPADLGAVGDAVVQRGMQTLQQNMQWARGEHAFDQKAFEDYKQYRKYSSELQRQTTEDRVDLMDKIARQRREVL
jgi:hypothetical protein